MISPICLVFIPKTFLKRDFLIPCADPSEEEKGGVYEGVRSQPEEVMLPALPKGTRRELELNYCPKACER